MQARTDQFDVLAKGHVRPIAWNVRASFDKTFDASVTFFTLDVSLLDGPDILTGLDDNPITAWDIYAYQDFTSRTISLEVTREETEPYSIVQAYGDVTLNNYDGYFTPNGGSPIDEFILPRRPFRLGVGFGNEALQQVVGLTEKMPAIDKASRTASFHVIDFMSYLYDKDITETIMLEDVRTDEVLDYLFGTMGLTPDQYVLDEGKNTIPFFYVERGDQFGSVVEKLIEAEIGSLYMDELGIIRFKNVYYQYLNSDIVYSFDRTNVIDYSVSDEQSIINSVKVTATIRDVQVFQSVWASVQRALINPGESVTIWADFDDPVTTLNDPTYQTGEIADSYYLASNDELGEVPYSDIDLTSLDLFSKSAKMVFTNSGGSAAYINTINLWGTPAKIVDTITAIDRDQDSVDKFEERLYEIDNPYIQTQEMATTRITNLLREYKDFGSLLDIEVKGNSALQLSDVVTLDLDGYSGPYVIRKEVNIVAGGEFKQRLRVRKTIIYDFFILDSSLLDSDAVLSP